MAKVSAESRIQLAVAECVTAVPKEQVHGSMCYLY